MRSFKRFNLRLPKINKGWFAKMDDKDYPAKISFAFFDGDFYQSIMDSFNKVYHKLSRGATICVHDYGWEILPGVKKACIDFLRDKPEAMCQEVEGVGFLIKE
jgi:O-methyltransferase